MSYLKTISNVREKLGLSQEEISLYLFISRTLFAKYEAGTRSLPTQALLKMGELELFFARQPLQTQQERPHLKSQQETAKQLLNKHARLQQYYLHTAQRKLEAMQKTYAQKMLLLDAVDALRISYANAPEDETVTNWLNLMEAKAKISIRENGLHEQVMLQLQISGYTQQYEHAMQLKAEIE